MSFIEETPFVALQQKNLYSCFTPGLYINLRNGKRVIEEADLERGLNRGELLGPL